MRAMCTMSIRLMMVLLALLLRWFRCNRFVVENHISPIIFIHQLRLSFVLCVLCAVGFWPLCVVHVLCAFHSLILCSFSYDSDVYELQNHDFNCRWKRDARYFLWLFCWCFAWPFKCFSSVVVAHAVVVYFLFRLISPFFQRCFSTDFELSRAKKLFIWILYDAKSAFEEEHTLRHQPIIGCIQYTGTDTHTLTKSKHWGMRWIDVWYFFFLLLDFCLRMCVFVAMCCLCRQFSVELIGTSRVGCNSHLLLCKLFRFSVFCLRYCWLCAFYDV